MEGRERDADAETTHRCTIIVAVTSRRIRCRRAPDGSAAPRSTRLHQRAHPLDGVASSAAASRCRDRGARASTYGVRGRFRATPVRRWRLRTGWSRGVAAASRHHRCGVVRGPRKPDMRNIACTRCGRVNHVTQCVVGRPRRWIAVSNIDSDRLCVRIRTRTPWSGDPKRTIAKERCMVRFATNVLLTGLAIALLGILVLLSTQADEAVRRQADVNLRQLRDIAAAIEREALNARNLQTDNDAQLQALGADLHARVEAIGRELARAVPGRRARPRSRAHRRGSRFQLDRSASPGTRRGRTADAQVRGAESIGGAARRPHRGVSAAIRRSI